MTMQSIMRPTRGSTLDATVSTTHTVVGPLRRDDIGFVSDVACYIKLGEDNTVTATANDYDLYVPATAIRDFSTGGATYMSVLATGSGTAWINEWTNRTL